jgi:acyl carrier protein
MQVKSEKIRQFIIDNFLFGQKAQLSDTASFLENGIIDSTGMLELISFLEEEHGISISTEELIPENLDSIARIARFLQQKLQTSEPNYEAAV